MQASKPTTPPSTPSTPTLALALSQPFGTLTAGHVKVAEKRHWLPPCLPNSAIAIVTTRHPLIHWRSMLYDATPARAALFDAIDPSSWPLGAIVAIATLSHVTHHGPKAAHSTLCPPDTPPGPPYAWHWSRIIPIPPIPSPPVGRGLRPIPKPLAHPITQAVRTACSTWIDAATAPKPKLIWNRYLDSCQLPIHTLQEPTQWPPFAVHR